MSSPARDRPSRRRRPRQDVARPPARTFEPLAIDLPADLPITAKRDEIADAIARSQIVIVAGETGSGKTTQLPKICLQLGRQRIAHTQPRRIAARTIAERIAEELGQEVGGLVGYQVRFTDRVGPDTRIALMTDGILLNAINHDRMLTQYDTIIIDEAHERTLTIDFLLGYLKRLVADRPDLTVIVTSATIDPASFARHFAAPDGTPAPVVEVSGRTFPVDVRYRPLVAESDPAEEEDDDPNEAQDRDYLQGILDALDELARESTGDVLVFLSGEQEIREAEDAVRGHYSSSGTTEVLPLYGRLSSADQHRVFQPSTVPGIRRRIVLATNVAETSLTVPGIRYVVDAGTARISRYSVRAKVQRLPIEAISQASANQRSGRSGRTSDGIAIRLYSEEDYDKRPAYTDPEILRTNLAAVILQMVSLGLGEIADFPFLTPPDPRGVKDGLDLLTELGAIAEHGNADGTPRLTRVGRDIARLPIDPRFARMVVESKRHSVSREVLAIVAGLSVQDPRERPLEKRAQADAEHARFADPTSDFLGLLALWNHLEERQRELSSSAFRRLCRSEYLNYLRVREWQDVYRQLTRLAKPLGLTVGDPRVDPDGIHRSLLAGLLSHLGLRDDRTNAGPNASRKPPPKGEENRRARRGSEYLGARNTRFQLFPGSSLAKKPPAAVMSAELVETSRLFARTNAVIDTAWAEQLAGDLAKRSYSEPHWERRQGAVVAYERVTLYGVPIVARRRIQYARIDLPFARDLFLRHALVDGDWDSQQAFDRANRALRDELTELEERTRRRDVAIDDERIHAFFDARIPPEIASTRDFEGWWRRERAANPELLTLTRADLVDAAPADDADDEPSAGFPDRRRQGDLDLPLSYRFEPGSPDDGVTVEVPLVQLAALDARGFDALVPGLRLDLVTALLRALPKAIRRSVVPAAEWAERIVAGLPALDDGTVPDLPFAATVAAAIRRLTGTPVDPADFDLDRVPQHLAMQFRVVDDGGRVLGSGRDLGALKSRFAAKTTATVAAASRRIPNAIERSGLTSWDFDELPDSLEVAQAGGAVVRGYPTLVTTRAGVDIRVVATPAERAATLPGGVRALLLAAIPTPVSYVQEHLTGPEKLDLATSPYPSTKALFDDCLAAVVDAGILRHSPNGMPTSRGAFEAVRDAVSADVVDRLFETVSLVARILAGARGASKSVGQATDLSLLPAVSDARTQLDGLVHRGFVSATGLARLVNLPRYLRAIARRMEQLPGDPGRDRTRLTEVQQATRLVEDAGGAIPLPAGAPERVVAARWMLEELRVSLFAQALGTAETVSVQRIRKVLTPPS